ncbi:MAG: glycosyltransferase [Cyclobacteriaceae bacterium]
MKLRDSTQEFTETSRASSSMKLGQTKVVVISHAGIKQINRAVYRNLKEVVGELTVIIPSRLQLSSGQVISAEPSLADDPKMVPMQLNGRNPRTYYYPDLISWLTDEKPDIIMLENDPVSRLGLQLSKWCRRNVAKIICQTYENLKRDLVTTLKTQGLKSLLKNQIISLLNAYMAGKVDALLVVNKDSESIFASYGYKNVSRIPLGYDKDVFFPNEEKRRAYRQNLVVSPDTVVIAYFGRLVRQKGAHILIQTLAELTAFNWVFLLDHIHDSEDDYVQYIRTLINDLKLEERVIFFEADHFEISNYMRAADIMVAPSITTAEFKEQYGRAVQEAMACGCVCVVSDSGNLKDLVGEPSLVFREGNIGMLKNTLTTLLQDTSKQLVFKSALAKKAASLLTTECQSDRLAAVMQGLVTHL